MGMSVLVPPSRKATRGGGGYLSYEPGQVGQDSSFGGAQAAESIRHFAVGLESLDCLVALVSFLFPTPRNVAVESGRSALFSSSHITSFI